MEAIHLCSPRSGRILVTDNSNVPWTRTSSVVCSAKLALVATLQALSDERMVFSLVGLHHRVPLHCHCIPLLILHLLRFHSKFCHHLTPSPSFLILSHTLLPKNKIISAMVLSRPRLHLHLHPSPSYSIKKVPLHQLHCPFRRTGVSPLWIHLHLHATHCKHQCPPFTSQPEKKDAFHCIGVNSCMRRRQMDVLCGEESRERGKEGVGL